MYLLICVFRLAFFELNYQFRTTSELQSEVIRHYSKQVSVRLPYKVMEIYKLVKPYVCPCMLYYKFIRKANSKF